MKSPAFPLYVSDFLQGTRFFTTEEKGAYLLLLLEQWDNGFVDFDEKKLKKISGISVKKLQKILEKFEVFEGKKLINRRLEEERNKQKKRREELSSSGIKGNEVRWGKGKSEAQKVSGGDDFAIQNKSLSFSSNNNIESEEENEILIKGGGAGGGMAVMGPKKFHYQFKAEEQYAESRVQFVRAGAKDIEATDSYEWLSDWVMVFVNGEVMAGATVKTFNEWLRHFKNWWAKQDHSINPKNYSNGIITNEAGGKAGAGNHSTVKTTAARGGATVADLQSLKSTGAASAEESIGFTPVEVVAENRV